MKRKSQTISIRLLHENKEPKDAVRDGVELSSWSKLPESQIVLDSLGATKPKWATFLELTEEESKRLFNSSTYALVFVKGKGRWFAISFGLGHVKLKLDVFEQDFGLRVVLNTVDPDKLRSADIRTPDENTTSRRMQAARRSGQTVFSIDVERDIVRGISGEPKNENFASRVAGSDGLILTKKMNISDLPKVCVDVLKAYSSDNYKTHFSWIDQIKHVRNDELINKLDLDLVSALNDSLSTQIPCTLHLTYPVIYDPEKIRGIRYKGFRDSKKYPDMEINGYVNALKEKNISQYTKECLNKHYVYECNDDGKPEGMNWPIRDCLAFETEVEGKKYVLSAGRWYLIDSDLAKTDEMFFDKINRYTMPPAQAGENEAKYNDRIAKSTNAMLSLDKKLVKPSGASSEIEVCDFLADDGAMIHVKNETSSSRLSHLFNQGTVSARVMKMDGGFRDRLRKKIKVQEKTLGKNGYQNLIATSDAKFDESKHLVVYAVLSSRKMATTNRLPFFSLVTLRQAVNQLMTLGYDCAFSWIAKSA